MGTGPEPREEEGARGGGPAPAALWGNRRPAQRTDGQAGPPRGRDGERDGYRGWLSPAGHPLGHPGQRGVDHGAASRPGGQSGMTAAKTDFSPPRPRGWHGLELSALRPHAPFWASLRLHAALGPEVGPDCPCGASRAFPGPLAPTLRLRRWAGHSQRAALRRASGGSDPGSHGPPWGFRPGLSARCSPGIPVGKNPLYCAHTREG